MGSMAVLHDPARRHWQPGNVHLDGKGLGPARDARRRYNLGLVIRWQVIDSEDQGVGYPRGRTRFAIHPQSQVGQGGLIGSCGWPSRGISAASRVPEPAWLSISTVPSSASTRSASPRKPDPFSGSAPPTPSSMTSITNLASRTKIVTVTVLALACLATLDTASATTK